MRVSGVNGLPVVDVQEKVIGVVTRTDLLDHLTRILEPVPQ
jgi:CBS domain-containing protein